MDLKEKSLKTIRKYGLLERGDRAVAAVSGGADSVCLLHVLHALRERLGVEVVAAHFDHGLRPAEDPAETRFVVRLARDLGVPIHVGKAVPGALQGSGSLEEQARQARYEFLDRVRNEVGARRIATAHHLDDQAETVLMRLLRGSGVSGLSGIRPLREDGVIRPLLEVTRREILRYLDRHGLDHVEDSSNLDSRFLRNRIRMEILPRLESIQPRITRILGKTAEIMRIQEECLEAWAERWLGEHGKELSGGGFHCPVQHLNALPQALRATVIRRAVRRVQGDLRAVGLNHVEAVAALAGGARPQATLDLPRGLVVRRSYGDLFFSRPETRRGEPGFEYPIPEPGSYDLDPPGVRIIVEERSGGIPRTLEASSRVAYLDADRLGYPLTVRSFRPGDRFRPLGMKGTKKVKDLFVDLKMPAEKRRKTPLLTHGDRIVWVCGVRIDERYKLTDETRRVVKITMEPLGKSGAP
ncbi:MAG: tRNA lysidine(34) synthetase TilS [Deltaproteobacteria bacterium]|nr:tRNA lysidine(34) synthetase TilS [Deltaproteobacteria bacterium]